jgi:sulfate permease, SulP family
VSARRTRTQSFAEAFTPKLVTVLREGYSLCDLLTDAIAGFSVAVVALPLSLAVAAACGLNPARGLYTTIIGGFLVSSLGGSRFQIGGPATILIVSIVSILERHGYDGLVLATLIAGVFIFVVGSLRWGTYIKYIPYSIIIGLTAGVALVVFVEEGRLVALLRQQLGAKLSPGFAGLRHPPM